MLGLRIFALGAMGAIVPDVLMIYSKRATAPLLYFEDVQVVVATLIYAATAGIVALIFPYPGGQTGWKSLSVGLTLPVIIGSVISASDRLGSAGADRLTTRGPTTTMQGERPKIRGTLVDLLAIY
jgi:hypothetical protein